MVHEYSDNTHQIDNIVTLIVSSNGFDVNELIFETENRGGEFDQITVLLCVLNKPIPLSLVISVRVLGLGSGVQLSTHRILRTSIFSDNQ